MKTLVFNGFVWTLVVIAANLAAYTLMLVALYTGWEPIMLIGMPVGAVMILGPLWWRDVFNPDIRSLNAFTVAGGFLFVNTFQFGHFAFDAAQSQPNFLFPF